LAEKSGFTPYRHGEPYAPGDRVYVNNRGKALYLAVIGREKLSEGFHMAAAHIDAPHLHIKPHPLFEDSELGYLKTHYYGMVRKHQWLAIPLELRGVFVLKDGTVRRVAIGQDPGDPLFTMTDLLPHLAQSQDESAGKAIEGEQLNLLIGSGR
jgi:aspartyl aminopeptidase